MGHFLGEHAPGIKNPWTYFRVAHHELLGHGLAVQRLRGLFDDLQIGITLSQFPVVPYRENPGPKDWEAVEFVDLFMNRFFLDGVFKASYPEKLIKRVGPFKPPIHPGDGNISTQPIDFLGVNYYSRVFAEPRWYIPFFRAWVERDTPAHLYHPQLGPHAYPQGMQELCRRYREEYGNPVIYITENGTAKDAPLENGHVHDAYRIQYMQHYLHALRQAISEGSDVRGYFYWSLVDNFEWNSGYACRMGLIHVNHDTQERIIKDSGYWMRDLIENQIY
jgi:beta-glucosidase